MIALSIFILASVGAVIYAQQQIPKIEQQERANEERRKQLIQ